MSPYLVTAHLFSLNVMEQFSMIKSITYILTLRSSQDIFDYSQVNAHQTPVLL